MKLQSSKRRATTKMITEDEPEWLKRAESILHPQDTPPPEDILAQPAASRQPAVPRLQPATCQASPADPGFAATDAKMSRLISACEGAGSSAGPQDDVEALLQMSADEVRLRVRVRVRGLA